jgi:predicted CXXCH cytochrome family protein
MATVGAVLAGLSDDDTKLLVLSPLDGSTAVSPIDCVVRIASDTAPILRVDGTERAWQLSAGRARRASLELAPGEHEVAIEDKRVHFTVTDNADAAELSRAHPRKGDGVEACKACHEVTEGESPEVRAVHQPDGCLACHTRMDFDLAHFHPLEPLRNCARCHALHGSSRAGLLRAPARELCSACHD